MNSEIRNIFFTEMLKKQKANLELDEIMDLLEHNDKLRYALFGDYNHEMHKRDILDEIEYINEYENKNITLEDADLEIILENYENRLDNTDEWYTHLTNTLRKFEIIE